MKITADISPMKIGGVDNTVIEAMLGHVDFGIRLRFDYDDKKSRFETILTAEEATELIKQIGKSLESHSELTTLISTRK